MAMEMRSMNRQHCRRCNAMEI
ncbi:hypothetical protein NC653_020376 [Populus alba x Populus x berolinensis]|uniref:Uncharacterized protein n=1 Tax=Populus alba x Populus x berolinensis TaxID=444605 RepID=A0AAD6QCC1_9ROSI|nr:hypothetical protein NC653_020376 [Populus alba x Populus x berolinensis]